MMHCRNGINSIGLSLPKWRVLLVSTWSSSGLPTKLNVLFNCRHPPMARLVRSNRNHCCKNLNVLDRNTGTADYCGGSNTGSDIRWFGMKSKKLFSVAFPASALQESYHCIGVDSILELFN
jgi:hypothetical protein